MTKITRRGFLKGTGMAAGAMAFTSFSPLSIASDNARGKGVLTAGRMGPLLCEVQDGKMVATKNALAQTVPNSLQSTGPDQVYTQARVKYPMVRKGFLANPAAPKGVRGSDEFVRVSWDDAYRLIHEQHMRIRKTYGPASVFAGSYGWRSSGCCIKLKLYCNAI